MVESIKGYCKKQNKAKWKRKKIVRKTNIIIDSKNKKELTIIGERIRFTEEAITLSNLIKIWINYNWVSSVRSLEQQT